MHWPKGLLAAFSICAFGCGHAPQSAVRATPTPAVQTFTGADVSQALNDAESLAEQGKYEQALERHIWYHKNALRLAPAHTGVRLSFALSSWIELGQKYPEALDALRAIRDDAVAGYKKSPDEKQLYIDAMSISLALDDLQVAKSLFYEGRKNSIVNSGLELSLNRIASTGDSKWGRDVIGDPQRALATIKVRRERMNSRLESQGTHGKGMLDDMFSREISDLLKATAKLYGLPTARKVQKSALAFLNKPEVKEALEGLP